MPERKESFGKEDVLQLTEPTLACVEFHSSFQGVVAPGMYSAIIQCREHAGNDHGYYLAVGMMVNEHTFTLLLEMEDYGKTFECYRPRKEETKMPEGRELEIVAASLKSNGENELAERIYGAANIISLETAGRLVEAATDIQKVSEELLDRSMDEPAIRLKAVIAQLIDSEGKVTLGGAMAMRRQLDELLCELESVVKRLHLRADEFYSMMRFDDPHMIHDEEFYDRLFTGFVWEAEEYNFFDALGAFERFIAHRKNMS